MKKIIFTLLIVFAGLSANAYCGRGGGSHMVTDSFALHGMSGLMLDTWMDTVFYADRSSISGLLAPGSIDTVWIRNNVGSSAGMVYEIWIDFNNDGVFNRTSESVGGASSTRGVARITLNIPSTAPRGRHALRLLAVWDASGYTYPHLDPCATGYVAGCIRDYSIGIIDGALLTDTLTTRVFPQCTDVTAVAYLPLYDTSTSVVTFYGDGTSDTSLLLPGWRHAAYVNFTHAYSAPGIYTIKQYLYLGPVATDSTTTSYTHVPCNKVSVRFFNDSNNNCSRDAGEALTFFPLLTRIDSNGVLVDSIWSTGGFDYYEYGHSGDRYGFHIAAVAGGSFTCDSTFYDTVATSLFSTRTYDIGARCNASVTDLFPSNLWLRTGLHRQSAAIVAENLLCNPASGSLTVTLSPKFQTTVGSWVYPTPNSSTTNSFTWRFSGIANTLSPFMASFQVEKAAGVSLSPRDTVHIRVAVAPDSSDVDTSNNSFVFVDTVRSGFDPNSIEVFPKGHIFSGTELKYTVHFENMGNDTAHNIFVLDTIPANKFDIGSLKPVSSSHEMVMTKWRYGSSYVVKFDFQNIKLLDSSHHGLCDGVFSYMIKTLHGLPDCTDIMNRVGIYFDYNDVVMTNEAHNIIGCWPAGTSIVNGLDDKDVAIFPNPAQNELIIRSTPGTFDRYAIIDQLGRVVASGWMNGARETINISFLQTGVYNIRFTGAQGATVKKFIKE